MNERKIAILAVAAALLVPGPREGGGGLAAQIVSKLEAGQYTVSESGLPTTALRFAPTVQFEFPYAKIKARASAFLSEVNLASNGGWSFSKSFTAGGLVYLSHQAEFADPNAVSSTNVAGISWPPTRFERSFLDVVDYADALHPAVRPPVNIPGTLQGLSHSGALLYTVGFHRTSTNWCEGENALDASAYDGVSAYLVDSLSLSNIAPHPVLVSGTTVFLGRAQSFSGRTNLVPPTLETWTLSRAGDFTNLGRVILPGAASDLVSFPGLLAAPTDGNSLLVFDRSDPAALPQVGEGPTTGCLYFNLRHGDGARARALWLPLEAYGVTRVELSP